MKSDVFEQINKILPRNIKVCFCSGMIIGLITHLYMITHKIPNWDDISQIDGLGLTNQVGRWMLEPLQYIGQKASNPAINGVLLIMFISLAACLVVSTLKLESISSAVLIPAVMVTFPSVTGVLYFMFTAHVYSVGILFFCLSAYLIQRFRFGFIPAGICIILGLAVYQPFVSVAISLMLMVLILDGLRGGKFKMLTINGLKYAETLAVSTFIYIQISKLIFPNMGEETYGGVNEMGKIALADIPKNFGRVYKRVLEYFITRPFSYVTSGMHVLNILVCALIVILFAINFIQLKLWKKKLELAFICLMIFFLPFAMGFVYFMAPNAPFSTLMLYAYSMLYVFALVLFERAFVQGENIDNQENKSFYKGVKTACTLAVVLTVFFVAYGNYLLDSQAYFRSSIAVERVTNYYNRIITRVEEMSGYTVGDRVAILGEFYYKDNPSSVEIPIFKNDENYRELDGVVLENGLITSGVRNNFIKTYLGFNPGYIWAEEKKAILNSEEYKEMPDYPAEGSIAKISDIWVVKLCE